MSMDFVRFTHCTWCHADKDNFYGMCDGCGRFPSDRAVETYTIYQRTNINPLFLEGHPEVREVLRTMTVEGVPFKLVPGDIETGDTYIAQRNTGLKLLTCRDNNREGGWINPVENAYSYDTGECIKIELLIH